MTVSTHSSEQLLAHMRRLHPLLIDLSLDRIDALLAVLGRPERRLPPVIHIAGTNGKGSVTAFLKAMLEAAGRRVHSYTSPHLVRFHERIALAGADGRSHPIDEAALADVLSRVTAANDGARITFFEITTAAAFLAFSETPADAVLLEVGLGGRLDTTNVVARPALSIITPVSIDHADKLGGTLPEIASEKAGILKGGVRAVISQQSEPALAVIKARAANVGAPLTVWGEDFDAYQQNGRLLFQRDGALLDLARPALLGPHQIVNAGTAVAAALELPHLGLDERSIDRGLMEAVWPARMQRLGAGPWSERLGPHSELWLDGAHNPAAGQALAQTLADLDERSAKPVVLIVGMLAHKDAYGFFTAFQGLVRHVVTVPIADAEDSANRAEALCEIATDSGLAAETATGVVEAIRRSEEVIIGPKRIVICGSLHLAGHVLALQEGVRPQPN